MELFDIGKIYEGFEYPYQLKKVAELELLDFDFWFIMDAKLAEGYTRGMQERFPARKLIPFAKRGDCDDVACFELENQEKLKSSMISANPAGNSAANTIPFGIGLWKRSRK